MVKETYKHLIIIGFFHENTRTDRRKYIDVDFDAIYKFEKSWYHRITNRTAKNYFMCNETKIGLNHGCKFYNPYDLGSISHYPPNIIGTNFQAIKVKNGSCKNGVNCKIGQRVGLSKTDVLDIASLYNCGNVYLKNFHDNILFLVIVMFYPKHQI